MLTRGVVYVATGRNKESANKSIMEVLRSIRLFLQTTPGVNKAIIGTPDVLEQPEIKEAFPNFRILSKYKQFDGFMGAKIQALELSPFDITLILDNDTLPMMSLASGFEFVGPGKRDIALAIAPKQEVDDTGVTNFQNGVMFVWKNERTLELFRRWKEAVETSNVRGPTRWLFSKLLLASDVSIYPLSYFWNLRVDLLKDLSVLLPVMKAVMPSVRVLHSHLQRESARELFKMHPDRRRVERILSKGR